MKPTDEIRVYPLELPDLARLRGALAYELSVRLCDGQLVAALLRRTDGARPDVNLLAEHLVPVVNELIDRGLLSQVGAGVVVRPITERAA